MKVVMLGAPGAGKGTQASVLSKKYSIPHISTGDIFRANIKNKTELGQKAKGYIDKGQLVPDELVVSLVIDRIKNEDCKNGFILDGFPRTIPQAEALDKALANQSEKINFVVDVEVPDEVIIDRMSGRRVCPKCGEPYHVKYKVPEVDNVCDKCNESLIIRKDDEKETVIKRLKVYHEQTQPLIAYYEKKGNLIKVNGMNDVKDVTKQIVSLMEATGSGNNN